MNHTDILNSLLSNTGVVKFSTKGYNILKLTSEYGSDAWFLVRPYVEDETFKYEILRYRIDNSDNALDRMLDEARELGIVF
jgi:hypothetical protein